MVKTTQKLPKVEARPATAELWNDVQTLFDPKGAMPVAGVCSGDWIEPTSRK